MPRFVALLRGVNVGKANRVPMGDLRAMLARMDYTDVATLLNSGNAVFTATKGAPAAHAAKIAAALRSQLDVDVPVIVKTSGELTAIVAENTLAGDGVDHARLLVAFTQDAAALAGLGFLGSLVVPPERFLLGKRAAYLYCAGGFMKSKAAGALLGQAGRSATTRNWATTLKLEELASRGAA